MDKKNHPAAVTGKPGDSELLPAKLPPGPVAVNGTKPLSRGRLSRAEILRDECCAELLAVIAHLRQLSK